MLQILLYNLRPGHPDSEQRPPSMEAGLCRTSLSGAIILYRELVKVMTEGEAKSTYGPSSGSRQPSTSRGSVPPEYPCPAHHPYLGACTNIGNTRRVSQGQRRWQSVNVDNP